MKEEGWVGDGKKGGGQGGYKGSYWWKASLRRKKDDHVLLIYVLETRVGFVGVRVRCGGVFILFFIF